MGLIGCHVDDLFAAGDTNNKVYSESIKELSRLLLLTCEQPPFKYCGKQVEQLPDFTTNISMKEYSTRIEGVALHAARKRRPSEPAAAEEKEAFESALGALGWLSRQLRMDVAFGYSHFAQRKNMECHRS